MKGRYINNSVEELLDDKEFVSIVKGIKKKEDWEQFLRNHIESKKNILLARKFILSFETSDGYLPDDKKYKLWKNISTFNKEFPKKIKVARIKTLFKVAAVGLILLSIGSLWYLNQGNQKFQFSESRENLKVENPLLVLSNGDQVQLEKDDSKIVILKDKNAIQINNDSIVENQTFINEKTRKIRFNEVIIPFGKKSSLVLADGTRVWLNAGSRFAFPPDFNGKNREVYLEGEGYFEVAKDEGQPFIISTNNINIEILGTKFNISAYNSDDFIETVLLEGSVNIWERNKLFKEKILMIPNQKATYSKIQRDIVLKTEPMPEAYIAWVEGWYEFTNENLDQVLKKLERYYNINFEYNRVFNLSALPVTGKLDLKDSLNDVMIVLSGVAKIDYRISGDTVILSNEIKELPMRN